MCPQGVSQVVLHLVKPAPMGLLQRAALGFERLELHWEEDPVRQA